MEDLIEEPDAEALVEEARVRAMSYLQLPIGPERVIFVNGRESLARAKQVGRYGV